MATTTRNQHVSFMCSYVLVLVLVSAWLTTISPKFVISCTDFWVVDSEEFSVIDTDKRPTKVPTVTTSNPVDVPVQGHQPGLFTYCTRELRGRDCYHPPKKLWESNVFSCICLSNSVHRGVPVQGPTLLSSVQGPGPTPCLYRSLPFNNVQTYST